MKATLIAAAFLIPTLVLANDPSMKDPSAAKTPEQVLNKLHKLGQKGVEQSTIAQANASNEKVKSFAERQQKDFQKLDQAALDLAKEKKITLASVDEKYGSDDARSGTTTTGTTGMGAEPVEKETEPAPKDSTGSDPAVDTRSGSGATGSTTPSDQPSDRMGSPSDQPATGESTDTRMGSTTGTAGSMSEEDTRWERIRSLKGAEFDAEYLSMTADNAKKTITMLEGARVKGDRKLDRLIDNSIKTFKDHQQQAEKLQREVRSAS